MIVLDTSAVLAVMLRQPGWEAYDLAMRDTAMIISGLAHGECVDGLHANGVKNGPAALDAFLVERGIEVQRFSKKASASAQNVFMRYGRAARPDGLSIAQSLTFALARTLKAPLLYTGTIYDHTPAQRVTLP